MTNINAEVQFYYADWCGYCVRFKPTWAVIKTNMPKDKDLEKVNLTFHECEDSNLSGDLEAKSVENFGIKIDSYPTLVLKIKNEYHRYPTDKRDYELIKKFIQWKAGLIKMPEEFKEDTEINKQNGGDKYRMKYKKYKQLYKDIMIKYQELKKSK
jgi:thiol-disulfide isomerase/thioredoxin